jgi:UDP-glucose 4-epimerase
MKILVTGGAGFIGSHIVDAYIAAGHDVAVVDNLSTGSRTNLNEKARLHEVDIREAAALESVFEQERPEAVNHLAAQMDVRRSLQEPIYDAQVNILGSINVLELCVKHGVKKFIFASTGGAIYGEPNPSDLPLSESYPPRPVCHYGTSKFSVEQYIGLYGILYGLPYTILRFPNVYGPRQNPHGEAGVCAILVGLMLEGKQPTLFGYGEPTRDYVYVGDIARANVLALDKADGEILNLGSSRATSVREIFDVLKKHIGYEGEPLLKPLRPGEINHISITGDKARGVLGWQPEVDLEEGLLRTLEHVKQAAAAGA